MFRLKILRLQQEEREGKRLYLTVLYSLLSGVGIVLADS